ncbi:MAG: hypothetical protein FJW38_28340 [Acidobacteria bacterium]|nr:hypothetical protein [Acidobacteriota bacterium]
MSLTSLQSDILRLLASHRDAESYVAGSTPLNRSEPRLSTDIDIFQDREARVAEAAESDVAELIAHGFEVKWLRREATFYAAAVDRGGQATRLEWAVDSDFRFFPAVPDSTFGYVLHPVDLATNKVSAACGRREPRDVVDLLTIHAKILPLGAAIWATVGKIVGFTPEGIINEIRRVARYTAADFERIASEPPLDPVNVMFRFREALAEAEEFVVRMPTSKAGLVFIENGRAVQPDPERLHHYTTHAGQRRGHWPTSVEITRAMLERLS